MDQSLFYEVLRNFVHRSAKGNSEFHRATQKTAFIFLRGMHAFAFARRTTKHSGITRVQARDVKSCDTLCRHGHDVTVADRTPFSFLKICSDNSAKYKTKVYTYMYILNKLKRVEERVRRKKEN